MERGDGVFKVTVLSVLLIIGICATAIYYGNTPTAEVISTGDFVGSGYGTVCETLYYQCDNLQVPYLLRTQGYQVTCCCPEHYQGNGMCLRPKKVTL